MTEKKMWKNVTIPFELFEMTLERAIVFKIRSGEYEGVSFVRPNKLVRKTKDLRGFSLGYTVIQELDDNGDVLSETAEVMDIKKTEKNEEGKWVTTYEAQISLDQLLSIIE